MVNFYNTLNRKKEEFVPIDENEVKIYCCGPTVYNYAHLGNLRAYVIEDLLVKTLKLSGYNVKHVMNVTDVGHLTSDADDGDDKMLLAAEKEKLNVLELARKYEKKFFEDFNSLGLKNPNVVCRATEHIDEMIEFIKDLEEKGFAYFAGGNVYFDTEKFGKYGKLSGQDRSELKHGERVVVDENKRNSSDFVLWFTSSKFENQVLQWDSPWGKGYPGWHIECSAMAMKYLGDSLDIHCGGIDAIPVHHENEVAQSEAKIGHKWCNHWFHIEFLQMQNAKMSKSTGGFLTIDSLREMGFKPEHYKYFCLQSHYKTQSNFSVDALEGAKNAYEKLVDKFLEFEADYKSGKELNGEKLEEIKTTFNNFMFDDLKSPQALAYMWDVLKDKNISNAEKYDFIKHVNQVFSLPLDNAKDSENEISDEVRVKIEALLNDRKDAKLNKDWSKADEIRDKLLEMGVVVKDLPNNEVKISFKR